MSNKKFRAITEVNQDFANYTDVVFVSPQFLPENAAFASNPWLFGIENDLSPQDEVAQVRSTACENAEERTDVFVFKRASAGHPNKDS